MEKSSGEPRIFKIIVVGDSNVGKTCLTYRFCEGAFPAITEATIGGEIKLEINSVFFEFLVDFKERRVEIDNEPIRLQIWDTAGQERFHTITTSYYRYTSLK